MNFIEQKRVLIWTIVVLLIFNITAGITILYHVTSEKTSEAQNPETDFLKKELSLNDEQVRGLGRIRSQFRHTSEPVASGIRETRQALIAEMAKNQSDTLLIRQLSDEMGELQGELTYHIATQYLNIRNMCTPEQAMKLNSAYQYLFGLEELPSGRGKGYRHRWGAQGRGSE